MDEIEIRVEQAGQLFNTLDPFPFRERDLAPDAEEYIVGWARELTGERALRIVVHLPLSEATDKDDQGIPEALAHFFTYRAEIIGRNLAELFRIGRLSLVIGLAVLGLCLIASQAVAGISGSGPLGRFLEESLIIVGWVANWRPIEIFLYDWWPLARQRALYRRLAAAEVVIRRDLPEA